MSLKPMYDNILVKPITAEQKSEGGIYLGNTDASPIYSEGVVIAVGQGYRVNGELILLKVKVGDTVIYRKGIEIEMKDENGETVVIFSEAQVLAIR